MRRRCHPKEHRGGRGGDEHASDVHQISLCGLKITVGIGNGSRALEPLSQLSGAAPTEGAAMDEHGPR
jgi:hypothetical protein